MAAVQAARYAECMSTDQTTTGCQASHPMFTGQQDDHLAVTQISWEVDMCRNGHPAYAGRSCENLAGELAVQRGITDPGVVAIATEGDDKIGQIADAVIHVPSVDPVLMPLVATIPLQLLSYHVADMRGTDIDQPRNLAKSVTVE